MSEEMRFGDVSIIGEGEVSAPENNENEIVLPPIPEGAIEYGSQGIDDAEPAGLASMVTKTFEVSDVDDPTPSLEAISSKPIIVTVADLTPADPAKEFVPLTQKALDDFDEEGGVSKLTSSSGATMTQAFAKPIEKTAAVIRVEEAIENLGSKSPAFNAVIQNALNDSENEGGIVAPKSTGYNPTDGDRSKEGFQNRSIRESEIVDKYRLYAFTVQYRDGLSMITRNVSDYFDEIDVAKYSINGGKYLMPVENGVFKLTDIISGLPELSLNDQRLLKYQGSEWTKC